MILFLLRNGQTFPTFPIRNKTSDIHVATMSYGHGIAVSPLNIISALATTVNGGEYIKPTVVIDPKLLSRPRIKVFDKDVFINVFYS